MPKKQILIIDDNQAVRFYFKRLLTREGYEVVEASRARDALNILREASFDLALLDLKLPDISGDQLLKQLKDKYPAMEVIIMTGYPTIETALTTWRSGAYDYLVKSVDRNHLPIVVARCLEKKKLVREVEYLKWLNLLYQTSETIGAGGKLDQTLKFILRSASMATRSASGSIMLYEKDHQEFVVKVVAGDEFKSMIGKSFKLTPAAMEKILKQDKPLSNSLFNELLSYESLVKIPCVTLPIRARKNLVGILNLVKDDNAEPFTDEDFRLLTILATEAGFIIEQARLTQELSKAYEERDQLKEFKEIKEDLQVAHHIQTGMLPSVAPSIPCLNLETKFLPYRFVGGDFYDYIKIDENQLGIAVGDVEGKGISASLIVARVLSILRSEAQKGISPRDVLTRINSFMLQQKESRYKLTLFYGVFDHRLKKLTYANAGHPNPIISRLSQPGEIIEVTEGDVPLGIFPNYPFTETRLQLKTGDKILIYTDGLIDAANDEGKRFNQENVHQVFKTNRHLSPQVISKKLVEAVKSWCGNQPYTDDLSILVIQMDDKIKSTERVCLNLPAQSESLSRVEAKTKQLAKVWGFSDSEIYNLNYATQEVMANVVKHAYPKTSGNVFIQYLFGEETLVIIIQDEGVGFDTSAFPSVYFERQEDPFQSNRRGVLFMLALMDEVELYSELGQGTEVRLAKIKGGKNVVENQEK